MKTQIEALRKDIKKLVDQSLEFRRQIHDLAWKAGSAADVQALRSKRDGQGHRIHGKKAVKAFRRPETGSDRNELNTRKNGLRFDIRHHLCVLGMLRGRAYAKIESPSGGRPETGYLHCLLSGCFQGNPPYTEEQIQSWLQGESLPHKEAA